MNAYRISIVAIPWTWSVVTLKNAGVANRPHDENRHQFVIGILANARLLEIGMNLLMMVSQRLARNAVSESTWERLDCRCFLGWMWIKRECYAPRDAKFRGKGANFIGFFRLPFFSVIQSLMCVVRPGKRNLRHIEIHSSIRTPYPCTQLVFEACLLTSVVCCSNNNVHMYKLQALTLQRAFGAARMKASFATHYEAMITFFESAPPSTLLCNTNRDEDDTRRTNCVSCMHAYERMHDMILAFSFFWNERLLFVFTSVRGARNVSLSECSIEMVHECIAFACSAKTTISRCHWHLPFDMLQCTVHHMRVRSRANPKQKWKNVEFFSRYQRRSIDLPCILRLSPSCASELKEKYSWHDDADAESFRLKCFVAFTSLCCCARLKAFWCK